MEGFGEFLGFPLKTTRNGKCFVVQHGMHPVLEM
jgi:hypothetical protein